MNVLWIKDNNIGHEKQVQVLLDELSNNLNLNIECRTVKGSIPFFRYIDKVQENFYDLIIGAGHKTYPILIKTKKNQKKSCKNIAVLAPSSNKMKFDVICAPSHDAKRLKNLNNVIFYEGSLAKVSTDDVDEKIGVIAIGGINTKNYRKLLLNKAKFLAISSYIWKNKKYKPFKAIERFR